MSEKKKIYPGIGWETAYGVKLQIKIEDLKQLPVNKWGQVTVFLSERKEVDPKSKATHYLSAEIETNNNSF